MRLRSVLWILLLVQAGYSSTISFLPMNGAEGSTAFVDDMGFLWTATGTTISTTKGVSGGASGVFSGGSVRANNASLFNPGAAAFTIDFWMSPNDGGPAANVYLVGRSHPDGGLGYDVRLGGGEILVVGVNGWGFNIGPSGASYVDVGQWGHVALSATETTAYLFYNGVLRGTSPRSPISDGVNAFAIGYQSNFGGAAFSGYIDDFRYSDTALWTADFTPRVAGGWLPSAPPAVTRARARPFATINNRLMKPRSVTAIYPGSFDPITNGHVDLIERGAKLCDRLIVAILQNESKQPLFSVAERMEMLREVVREYPNAEIDCFEGLLVDYAARKGATAILRGIRAVSDYEYELQMALMNRRLHPEIETVFLMAGEAYSFISSRLVKEVFSLGGDIGGLVPPSVEARLRKRLTRGA